MKDKFISTENFNRLSQANNDLNKLINLIKNDSMTFDHLCSFDYVTKTVIPYYKSDLNILRVEKLKHSEMVDIETDKFIVKFFMPSEEGISSGYKVCNNIVLGKSAEVEVESGYMDNDTIHPLLKGGYHFIVD